MDLYDSTTRLSLQEYERRSYQVLVSWWLEWVGKHWSPKEQRYYPLRTYYVDEQEVVVIADWSEGAIKSCLHEHYDRPHVAGRHPTVPVGERQNDYKKH